MDESQLEKEIEYARQNDEYLEARRERQRPLRQPRTDFVGETPEKRRGKNYFCCWLFIIVFLVVTGIAFYLILNFQEQLPQELENKKGALEKLLPGAQAELKTSIDQGEQLYNDTEKSVNEVQQNVDKAKQIYDTGKEVYDKVNQIKNAP